jgi:putative ABC transport system permease protein
MLIKYFKTTLRSLRKNKVFFAINILGLSTGIAAFLLIASYLRFEYSYDCQFQNNGRIYRIPMVISKKGEKQQAFAYTYPAVAPALKEDIPEIQEVARLTEWGGIVTYGDKMIAESKSVYYTDPSFFRIFSFHFVKGNALTPLKELNDAVITTATAKKYFSDTDPIGKALHYLDQDYLVKAVVELPPNSHFRFNILLNADKIMQRWNGVLNTIWGQPHFYTYVLTKPNTNASALQAKLTSFADHHLGAQMKQTGNQIHFFLQPLKDIHLHSTYDYEMEGSGNFSYLKYLAIAAVFILLIAWINYVNLSTAISLDRYKEVTVRKVLGAGKLQLVRQFLTESLFLNIVAILLGILLFRIALPSFSNLVQQDIRDLIPSDRAFWLAGVAVLLFGTLLAAFYPAFVLSSFRPINTIRNSESNSILKGGKSMLRKSLVVFQFTTAIVLIAGAIGFYRQLHFMQTRDLGVNIQQTLVLQKTPTYDSSYIHVNAAFTNELRSNPSIVSVTASDAVPGSELRSVKFTLKNGLVEVPCRSIGIDTEFVSAYGLKIIAGRNLLPTDKRGLDTSYVENDLVNESAAKILGFSNPSEILGQELIALGFIKTRVVGVVKDFHQRSLQHGFDPIFFGPVDQAAWECLSLKLNTNNLSTVMDFVKKKWSNSYPDMPFRYFFLDDHFNAQYKSDQVFATVLWLFTTIAIVIAALGLFALSLFTIAKRSKEISIRKVLGATVFEITRLMAKDYMKLVVIAVTIALPLAYIFISNWLTDYAFRIDLGLWFFLFPAIFIISIALVTVLYQSVKAANSNPVKNLRSE